jgi:hypothetical protein
MKFLNLYKLLSEAIKETTYNKLINLLQIEFQITNNAPRHYSDYDNEQKKLFQTFKNDKLKQYKQWVESTTSNDIEQIWVINCLANASLTFPKI